MSYRQRKSEAEITAPIHHRYAGEIAHPVQIPRCGQAYSTSRAAPISIAGSMTPNLILASRMLFFLRVRYAAKRSEVLMKETSRQ